MTNEDLVIRIQDGETNLYCDLWENNRKLIVQIMKNKLHSTILPCYLSIEDLEQEMYFALLQAVKYYDRDKPYSFTTYLSYPILTVLNKLVFNDKSIEKECSFNAKIADNDGKMIEKWALISDPDSNKAYKNIENEDINEKVRQAVAALKDRERTAVELYYFHNHTYEEIAALLHVNRSRAGQIIKHAMSTLRRDPSINQANLEHRLHATNKEDEYSYYASLWMYSEERVAAEKKLHIFMQNDKYISYGKQKAYMQLAKSHYISDKIREAQEIKQAISNRLLP